VTDNVTQSTPRTPHKCDSTRWSLGSRILLVLFIVSQVVNGAPVAAREKLKGRIGVDGTAALQKRVNPVEEGSTNMAGQTPPSPDRTEVDRLWQEMGEHGVLIDSPTPLDIPGWSSPPFSKESPTESIGSNPTPPPPTSPPPLPEEHLAPAWLWTTDTPSTTGHQPTPQQNPGPDLDVHPPLNPEPHPPAVAEMPVDDFLDMLMEGNIKRTFMAPVL
jgi:hypothetical protein